MTAVEILMTLVYCRGAAANRAFLCSPALTGSAKCSQPGPHPVHTQTRGAGECIRHAAVSRWV